ncbi:heterokaryon incompatibility protein-domain-containing protein [Podospora aff. communis PSN243]|uniref:Heterokaryon incompatibility protein-domain-containing protein n=1 Tax=Podospora aff. communis PSN243 TaxID=3040156 RepID=A0AAV9GTJ0_9PEZI|nr:heterokaryon incompatibility protein-domain-containing protein [Podospora aff. communis PSN243]
MSTSSANDRVETSFPITSNPYIYKALAPGEFRLLALHAGFPNDPTDPIRITIQERKLANADNMFQALSYTWAPTTPWKEVYCGDGNTSLYVTSNLYDALVSLRQPNVARILWIDQLAINQRDTEEKSAQVQLMGQIYAKALDVRVWLSSDMWKSSHDFVHLSNFTRLCDSSRLVGMRQALRDMEGNLPNEAWEAMFRLLQSSYFGRVWMIQEVTMAKQCGVMVFGRLINWVDIVDLSMMFGMEISPYYNDMFPANVRRHVATLGHMVTIRHYLKPDFARPEQDRGKWTLLNLLHKTWRFGATDQRDKFYALLALVNDFPAHCLASKILPDYSSDNTFESLAREAFLETLTGGGPLECLDYCTSYTKQTTPSWMGAVDIGFGRPHDLLMKDLWDAGGMMADPCPSHVRRVSMAGGPEELLSFRVTRIGSVFGSLPALPSEQVLEERLRLWISGREDEANAPQQPPPPHVAARDRDTMERYFAACKEITMEAFNPLRPGVGPGPHEIMDMCFRAFLFDIDPDSLGGHAMGGLLRLRRNTRPPPYYTLNDLYEKTPHWPNIMGRLRFCIGTKPQAASDPEKPTPLLCWVPPCTEQGDEICVVHGYRFPMVIRRVPGKEYYRFMGIAYVQGHMDGEALNGEFVVEDLVFN